MRKEFSKYRLISVIALFLICALNIFLFAVSPEIIKSNSQVFENEMVSNHDQNLEFRTENSASTSAGLKVEIPDVLSPDSFDSGDNHLSSLNHLINIYSKKKYSLISHSNLVISTTVHISLLITKLQI